LKWIKHLLSFIIEGMTRALLQLWLIGRELIVPEISWTQESIVAYTYANIVNPHLLSQAQINSLNQPEAVVFLAWNGAKIGLQTSSLLLGNPMDRRGISTNTTSTNHWASKMETCVTTLVPQLTLAVLLVSVLMVCPTFNSN
jgi:hypothetical protein